VAVGVKEQPADRQLTSVPARLAEPSGLVDPSRPGRARSGRSTTIG